MANAPNYTPTTGFATDETNQAAGRSTVKTSSLDVELANISTSINSLNENLQRIQRDDGKILDGLIEPFHLSEQVRAVIVAGGRVRGIWSPETDYHAGDSVQSGPVPYLCYKDHKSGLAFSADGFWMAISGDGQSMVNAAAAAASATAAAASATSASSSATTATSAATSATSSAATSTTKANEAANSATAASASAATATSASNSASTLYNNFNTQYLAWLSLGIGFSNMEVHAAGTTWTVPAGVTKGKVTVVAGAGGNTSGNPSSFGSLLSATGGGAQISGVYGSTTNLAISFNTPGVGVGGDINLSGQPGTDTNNANLSGSSQTRLANAAGGMTALGLGRGSNVAASETVSANGRLVARGGAGGGVAIAMLDLTPGDTHELTVGIGGGNGASDGLIIIEY